MESKNTENVGQDGVLTGYVSLENLSLQINKSKRTLQRLHAKREGPKRIKIGRTIYYKIADVREWLDAHAELMAVPARIRNDIKQSIVGKKMMLVRKP